MVWTPCLGMLTEVGMVWTLCLAMFTSIRMVLTCRTMLSYVGMVWTPCQAMLTTVGMLWKPCLAMFTNIGMVWTPCLAMFTNVGMAWLMSDPFQHLVLAMLLAVGSVWTTCFAILIDVDRRKCHTFSIYTTKDNLINMAEVLKLRISVLSIPYFTSLSCAFPSHLFFFICSGQRDRQTKPTETTMHITWYIKHAAVSSAFPTATNR